VTRDKINFSGHLGNSFFFQESFCIFHFENSSQLFRLSLVGLCLHCFQLLLSRFPFFIIIATFDILGWGKNSVLIGIFNSTRPIFLLHSLELMHFSSRESLSHRARYQFHLIGFITPSRWAQRERKCDNYDLHEFSELIFNNFFLSFSRNEYQSSMMMTKEWWWW
jgi:hypothetical protein